jgi:hypothetical protein
MLQRPGVCFARHRFRSEMISSDLKEHLLACIAIFHDLYINVL